MYIVALYDHKRNKVDNEQYKEIDLNDIESFSSVSHATPEFAKLASTRIGNKSIMEWFEVDGTSFWWFVHPTIYPKYNEAILFINRLSSFLEIDPTDRLELKGAFDKLSIVKELCNQKQISLKISQRKFLVFKLTNFAKNLMKKYAYKKITEQKHKKRLECFARKKSYQNPLQNCVIITSAGFYRREVYSVQSRQAERQEFILQPILDLLSQNKIPTLCFDLDYTFRGETRALEERLDTKFNWIPIEIILKKPKQKFVKESLSKLKTSIQKMHQDDIEGIFMYKNISIWKYLKPTFDQIFFEPYLPTYLHLSKELEGFFEATKPEALIQIYETGPYAKAFEIVAKKFGVRTIGLQHGLIYDGNPDYTHREIQSNKIPLGYPIPNFTLVFGNHYKKVLTENGYYPTDKVVVIGNLAFHNIDKIKHILNRDKILRVYNLVDKKIILVALAFSLFKGIKNNPDHALLEHLYKGLKDQNEVILLIRPHPSDSADFGNKLNELFPTTNFVPSKCTLFEDIFISDAVVTTISAVGVDSVIFEKPVIFANLGGNTNTTFSAMQKDMIEHEVALSCSKEELTDKILSIKKGELWTAETSQKRKEFLESYFNLGGTIDLLKLICGDKFK